MCDVLCEWCVMSLTRYVYDVICNMCYVFDTLCQCVIRCFTGLTRYMYDVLNVFDTLCV